MIAVVIILKYQYMKFHKNDFIWMSFKRANDLKWNKKYRKSGIEWKQLNFWIKWKLKHFKFHSKLLFCNFIKTIKWRILFEYLLLNFINI